MLVRLHVLLELVLTLSIQFRLRLTLLLRTQVVQEVDVLLTQRLLLRAQTRKLTGQACLLTTQRTKPLGQLCTDAELLTCQSANTLTKLLLQACLLTKDVGLLSRQLTVQGGQTGLLTTKRTDLPCGCLTELSLLQLLLANRLANLTLVLRCLLCSLCTLRFLRSQLLRALQAHLTGLRLLLCSRQPQLTHLTRTGHLTLARGLHQACALQAQLAEVLCRAQRADARLTQHLRTLQAQLSPLDAVLSLHLLVGQIGLLLRLLIGQRQLHGLLRIHALSLQAVGFVLHSGLLSRVEVGQRGLQARLHTKLLRLLLRRQILLAHREARSLVGQGGLQCLLSVHALRLQLSSLVLDIGLLRRAEVGQSRLQPRLRTQLLHTKLSRQVLLTNRKACGLIGLLSREPRLLLRVELLLGLLESLLQACGLDVALLTSQSFRGPCLLHAESAAAKSTGLGKLRAQGLPLNVRFPLRGLLLTLHHALYVGRHKGFSRARLGKAAGGHLRGRAHLERLQIGLESRLGSRHQGRANLLCRHALGRAHLIGLNLRSKTRLRGLNITRRNSRNSACLRGLCHRSCAQASRLLGLLRSLVQGINPLTHAHAGLANSALTHFCATEQRSDALLETRLSRGPRCLLRGQFALRHARAYHVCSLTKLRAGTLHLGNRLLHQGLGGAQRCLLVLAGKGLSLSLLRGSRAD